MSDLIPTRWLKAILSRLLAQNPLRPQIGRRPLLKQLTPDGEVSIGVDIAYTPSSSGEMHSLSSVSSDGRPGASRALPDNWTLGTLTPNWGGPGQVGIA
ncbi:hypothetical protein M422DRAFT_268960 [Sphaerobolus stellatus SS14]|uniref:Uncharacterized protein n=1 Tax=Sphaerobolus stellatus (strain SS14) TaxID=990650 RepID=A0A0C9U5P3_SPHS4|nr:hypothetical protein M422DRAFT_268960 [Sphaerobolus stellatus SS14]